MYLYRPNFFIHRSIVLVQVSFVFVHITPVCIQRGRARSVSYLKQNNKKNVRLLSLLWRFECVMIFYLYFCTKSIEKKKEGGRFFFSSSGEWVAYNIVVWIYIGVLVVQREGGVGGLFGTI